MVTLGAEETVDRYNCLKSLDIIQNEKTIYRIVLLQQPINISKQNTSTTVGKIYDLSHLHTWYRVKNKPTYEHYGNKHIYIAL